MKKLFIIFAVLCLAVPSMAADWNFYGSARFATFSVDEDPDIPGVDSDTDTQWNQNGNSRIGAKVKFNDEIGGAFEMSDSFGKRKLYGTYSFGGSELLIGQDYTPTSSYFYSNSVFDADGDLLGVGQFYVGRRPMIQWKMGGLKVALVTPSTATANATTDIDTTLPKIEASYRFKTDAFFLDVYGGYNSFTDEAVDDYDYDSYVAGIGGGLTLGPVYINVGAHMGQNLGNYDAYNPVGIDDEAAIVGTEVKDNDGLGYMAVLGFNVNEMFTLEAGYGHEEAELDDSNNTQEADQYYVNCVINIAPGFFIVPEVGMVTYSEDVATAEPEVFYWGAKWQINF